MNEAGVKADKEAIETMIKAINGKKLHELVEEGQPRLASIAAPATGICFELSLF